MSREKIEEMAKIAQDAIDYYSSGDCPYSPCRYRDSSICCDVCASIKALCDAGYRKQSEGEWKKVYQNDVATVYECSNCKHLTFGTSDYCICGAKMKDGAE